MKALFTLGLPLLVLTAFMVSLPSEALAKEGALTNHVTLCGAKPEAAYCNPRGVCQACTTCNYCGHCAQGGGKCSTCR